MEWAPLPQYKGGRIRAKPVLQRRSRTEIALDLLLSLKQGESLPTRMMYSANLSWTVLMQQIALLTSEGLLERRDRWYYLTPKGFGAVASYEEAKRLLGEAAIQPVAHELGRRI